MLLKALLEATADKATGKLTKYGIIAIATEGDLAFEDLEEVSVYVDEKKFQNAIKWAYLRYASGSNEDPSVLDDDDGDEEHSAQIKAAAGRATEDAFQKRILKMPWAEFEDLEDYHDAQDSGLWVVDRF